MSRDLSHIMLIPDVKKTCRSFNMGKYAIVFNENFISRDDAIACVEADSYSPYVLCIPQEQWEAIFYNISPARTKAEEFRVCHECGEKMLPSIISKTIQRNGRAINISNINAYKCPECGEVVLTDHEVSKIECLVQKLDELHRRDAFFESLEKELSILTDELDLVAEIPDIDLSSN